MYASSAWFGFANKTDQQQVDVYFRRSKKRGCCPPELPSFQEQTDTMALQLFDEIQRNNNHLLFNLRTRPHSQQLLQRTGHLTDSNFLTRMLSLTFTTLISIVLSFLFYYEIDFCQFSIKRKLDWMGV